MEASSSPIKDLTNTAKAVAKDIVNGQPIMADNLLINNRIEICNKCEFISLDSYRCNKCGCFMKIKTQINAAKCPINKW